MTHEQQSTETAAQHTTTQVIEEARQTIYGLVATLEDTVARLPATEDGQLDLAHMWLVITPLALAEARLARLSLMRSRRSQ